MEIKVDIQRAKSMLIKVMQAGLVPMVHGSPAVGKSSVVKQIAKEYNLKLIDLRLGQCDPTDLLGFPYTNDETKKSGYRPMETFPIAGDPLPKDEKGNQYNGWLLFLDELTNADIQVQGAAYKLILDRQTGIHDLHPSCAIMAAGNLTSDNAAAHQMSTALQSRMVHIVVDLNFDVWMNWAIDTKIDHRIRDFLNFKREALYTFKPDHTDKTYGSPRTWEFMHRILEVTDVNDPDILALAAGTLGTGLAKEFLTFVKIYGSLPTMDAILADPEGVLVPDNLSAKYAICGSISNHMKPDNADALIKFLFRMPIEFQSIALRDARRRDNSLINIPAFRQWCMKNAENLF